MLPQRLPRMTPKGQWATRIMRRIMRGLCAEYFSGGFCRPHLFENRLPKVRAKSDQILQEPTKSNQNSHQTLPNLTNLAKSYKILPNSLPDRTRCYQNPAKSPNIALNPTKSYRILPNPTKSYKILPKLNELRQIV